MRAPPARTRTPEMKVRTGHHERQRAREREAVESSVHHRHGLPAEPNKDEWLLAWVYCRSLTTAETDAWRVHRKNAKALRHSIEQSEREALGKVMEAAWLAKLRRQQDQAVQRLKGLVIVDSSSSPPPRNQPILHQPTMGTATLATIRGKGWPGSGEVDFNFKF